MTLREKSIRITCIIIGVFLILLGIFTTIYEEWIFDVSVQSVTIIIGTIFIIVQLLDIELSLLLAYAILIYPMFLFMIKSYFNVLNETPLKFFLFNIIIVIGLLVIISAGISSFIDEIILKKILLKNTSYIELNYKLVELKNKKSEMDKDVKNNKKSNSKISKINKEIKENNEQIKKLKKKLLKETYLEDKEFSKIQLSKIDWGQIFKFITALIVFITGLMSIITK